MDSRLKVLTGVGSLGNPRVKSVRSDVLRLQFYHFVQIANAYCTPKYVRILSHTQLLCLGMSALAKRTFAAGTPAKDALTSALSIAT